MGCARGVGISKTLAVRQRIKGILYSPETIRVAFDYGSIPDGQEGLNSLASDSAPQADDSRPGSLPKIEKGSDLLAKSDPFRKFDSKKTWTTCWPPHTAPIDFANVSHDFWSHYRLTGQFNLRPTL